MIKSIGKSLQETIVTNEKAEAIKIIKCKYFFIIKS